ncbi:MAG: hypothetical protein PHV74_01515 [Dehalococcoidia bacterium]|nr:hypothetical protein [Dehalococcoidia bacterium]
MKKLLFLVPVIILVAMLVMPGIAMATKPPPPPPPTCGPCDQPKCGTAIVDGDKGEWVLDESAADTDFFANMFNAGEPDPTKPNYALLSKLYVKYDCDDGVLYVLVLAEPGVLILAGTALEEESFVKLGNDTKLVDGTYGNDGTPPDFQWINQRDNADGRSIADGWEASMRLSPNQCYDLNVHTQVWVDGESKTSAVANRGIPLAPTPEVSTVILLTLGVLALGGFVWMARRKHAEAV